jgi:cytochrome c peroxidase
MRSKLGIGRVWLCLIAVMAMAMAMGCPSSPPPAGPIKTTAKGPGEAKIAPKTGTGAAKAASKEAKTEAAPEVKTEAAKTPDAKPEAAPEEKTEAATQPEAKPAAETPKEAARPAVAQVKGPLGLGPMPIPVDNPQTPEKIELGKLLFFDPRLSKDGKVSCATCHNPKEAYAEHEPVSTGIGNLKGGRNSPTVINSAYAKVLFWDGRASSLEEQSLGPIENPVEMGHSLEAMIQDLSKLDEYKQQFQKVFGAEITKDGVGKAIAAFERTILSGNSPYDRYLITGDKTALSESQQRGLNLFDSVGCSTCHIPPTFSNYNFYNAGVGMDKPEPDKGRMDVTKKESDLGKFRVPPLREVANTAPYFHDGSVDKLEGAVALMAGGGKDNPSLSPMILALRQAKIGEQEQKDLAEFLKALSGEYPMIEPPKLP